MWLCYLTKNSDQINQPTCSGVYMCVHVGGSFYVLEKWGWNYEHRNIHLVHLAIAGQGHNVFVFFLNSGNGLVSIPFSFTPVAHLTKPPWPHTHARLRLAIPSPCSDQQNGALLILTQSPPALIYTLLVMETGAIWMYDPNVYRSASSYDHNGMKEPLSCK